MPTEIKTTVYTFDELSDKAKEKARGWYRQLDGDTDVAWETTQGDAEGIGLKIKSLDQHRANIGEFTDSAENVAAAILKNHGPECATYKTAKHFLNLYNNLEDAQPGDREYTVRDAEGFDAIESEFLHALLEDYRVMFQDDLEYRMEDAQVDESILANEYTFTIDGKRFG